MGVLCNLADTLRPHGHDFSGRGTPDLANQAISTFCQVCDAYLPLTMDPIPLPSQPFAESSFRIAYQRCLALEDVAQAGLKPIHGYPTPLVCARLLGHLLRLAPNTNGRGQLQREITSAENDAKLMELAKMYFNGFIRACKSQLFS